MRARRDEEALRVEPAIGERLIRMMPVVREAALQPAAKLREMREPASVRGELIAVRQPVANPEPLERQVGERRRRLTDREARMRAALEKHDIVAEHREHARQQRSGEPAADDGNLAAIASRASHTATGDRAAPRGR